MRTEFGLGLVYTLTKIDQGYNRQSNSYRLTADGARTAQLTQIAEDPDIQTELATIDAEFAIAQMDGLGIQ